MKIYIAALLASTQLILTPIAYAEVSAVQIDVKVTKSGFEPASIQVAAGQNVSLMITRTTNSTCATSVQIPDLKVEKDLPLNVPVLIELGQLQKGQIGFGCSMGMMISGIISIE